MNRLQDKVALVTGGARGLGLAIVRGFVEAHGGTLLVESRPGEGTLVTVTLPVVAAKEHGGPPSEEPAGARPDTRSAAPG